MHMSSFGRYSGLGPYRSRLACAWQAVVAREGEKGNEFMDNRAIEAGDQASLF